MIETVVKSGEEEEDKTGMGGNKGGRKKGVKFKCKKNVGVGARG